MERLLNFRFDGFVENKTINVLRKHGAPILYMEIEHFAGVTDKYVHQRSFGSITSYNIRNIFFVLVNTASLKK